MAGEWKERRLSEVMDVTHGFAFPGEGIRDEPSRDILVTPGNFAIGGGFKSDRFKYFDGEVPPDFVFDDGDLIVTMTDLSKQSDTLGYPALVPSSEGGNRFLHNQRVGKVITKPGADVDKRFLFYLLRTNEYRHEVLASATGTSIKHTSPTRILAYKTNFPPLREQQAIACILGSLDDKIELNRRMNRTLEGMARAIFKSWFVDFDPVRAKAAGQPPPGLKPALAALFPDRLEDSPLGPIPAGWRVGTLGEMLTLQRGFDLPADARHPGPYPVIAASGHNGTHNSFVVRGPGVTTGRSGVLGRVFYVHGDFWPLNTSLFVKEFKGCGAAYAFQLLSRLDFGLFNAGSAVPTLNRNHVHTLQVVMPDRSVCNGYETIATNLLPRQKAAEDESRTLAALRDALLPKLISGELRVPDAERIMVRSA